jgi:hypothetical protein
MTAEFLKRRLQPTAEAEAGSRRRIDTCGLKYGAGFGNAGAGTRIRFDPRKTGVFAILSSAGRAMPPASSSIESLKLAPIDLPRRSLRSGSHSWIVL